MRKKDCNILTIILVQGFCSLKTEIARFPIGFCLNISILVVTLLGCGGRLEIKGGGGDDDDDDDDDGRDDKNNKDVCKAKNWTPPLIDFQKSSNPKIKFCLVKPKDTERCNMQTASYLGFDQWRNFTSLQQRFWTSKNKKDMYLQVNQVIKAMVVFQVVCCAGYIGRQVRSRSNVRVVRCPN